MLPSLTILIPAAGASSRMRGRDKLLEVVDGQPLLRRQTGAALTLGVPVLVTLPPADSARAQSLEDLQAPRLTCLPVPGAAEGMSASLRAGAQFALKHGETALMIFLPDLPGLTAHDLSRMVDRFAATPTTILRAIDKTGTPGHPVILPSAYLPELSHLTGDSGARDMLRRNDIALCPLPGDRATCDLDTPEAWATWRAAHGD